MTQRFHIFNTLRATTIYLSGPFIVYLGWTTQQDNLLSAENGLGYALGIIGSSIMLLLLFYPLRKRLHGTRFLGSVKQWFRIHMIVGLVGPLLILFHANFSLSSINSTVALTSMLLVATSGLIGRYIYTRIYQGLYDARSRIETLHSTAHAIGRRLNFAFELVPELKTCVQSFESAARLPTSLTLNGLGRSLVNAVWAPWIFLRSRHYLRRALAEQARVHEWNRLRRQRSNAIAYRSLALYLRSIRKAAELGFYERLFSLWHILHLPLFLMMIVTAIAHVTAVHMY